MFQCKTDLIELLQELHRFLFARYSVLKRPIEAIVPRKKA